MRPTLVGFALAPSRGHSTLLSRWGAGHLHRRPGRSRSLRPRAGGLCRTRCLGGAVSRPAAGFAGYASLRLVGSDNPLMYIHIFMNMYVFVSPSYSSLSASERRERRVLYSDCATFTLPAFVRRGWAVLPSPRILRAPRPMVSRWCVENGDKQKHGRSLLSHHFRRPPMSLVPALCLLRSDPPPSSGLGERRILCLPLDVVLSCCLTHPLGF